MQQLREAETLRRLLRTEHDEPNTMAKHACTIDVFASDCS
jgi:hypothetical protein